MKLERGTVIFDLDETLAHCVTDDIFKADKQITVTLTTGEKVKAGVNIRPHAVECLTELAKDFELIVFTASHPYYADRVIDILDPNKTLFSHRLFRNNCVHAVNGVYIKDLRVINRDLSTVVIIDNSILSFAFQLDNGIPIIPFYDDKEDDILPKIKDYIMSLKNTKDFRTINKRTFSLKSLYDLNLETFLHYYDDDESDNETDEDDMDSFDNSLDEHYTDPQFPNAATGTDDDPQLVSSRKSSSTPVMDNFPKIGKRAQAVVESELGKLRVSLPKYLEGEKKGKSDFL